LPDDKLTFADDADIAHPAHRALELEEQALTHVHLVRPWRRLRLVDRRQEGRHGCRGRTCERVRVREKNGDGSQS